jgi:hypothetical protein
MVREGEHFSVVATHMCVHLGGNDPDEVVDVSTQYADLNNAQYFRNWFELTKACPFTQHTNVIWLNSHLSNQKSSGKEILAEFIKYERSAKKLNHFLDENPDRDGIGMCPFGCERIPYYDNMMEHILPTMSLFDM